MTTPTPGSTTVAAASSGGFLSDVGNFLSGAANDATLGLGGKLVAPAVSTYEGLKTGVSDTASATEAVAEVVIQGAEWMANPHNWVRVGMVIIGGAVILIGVYVAFQNTAAGHAAKTGAKLGAMAAA